MVAINLFLARKKMCVLIARVTEALLLNAMSVMEKGTLCATIALVQVTKIVLIAMGKARSSVLGVMAKVKRNALHVMVVVETFMMKRNPVLLVMELVAKNVPLVGVKDIKIVLIALTQEKKFVALATAKEIQNVKNVMGMGNSKKYVKYVMELEN